jgi:hypothetical protein
MRETYPWIVLVFVPACCTGKLQICDTVINYPFKHRGKQLAVAYVCYQVKEALRRARAEGVSEDLINSGQVEVRVDLRLLALKPRIPMWIKRQMDHLKTPAMKASIVR